MITQENIPYTADEIKAMVKICEKYNKALERAKYALTTDMDNSGHWAVNYIFPELKESKDERIRKGLVKAFGTIGKKDWGGLIVRDVLAWLEKQGEKDPRIGCTNDKGCVTCENDNTKETKSEPKFHPGDWVIDNVGKIYQIEKAFKSTVKDIFGYTIVGGGYLNDNDDLRLWTIQDAKDGDVLANDHHILILKESVYDWYTNGTPYSVKAYCGIKPNGNFEIGKDNWSFCGTIHIHPATKEQRGLLFRKMEEAGYQWDVEKKCFKI